MTKQRFWRVDMNSILDDEGELNIEKYSNENVGKLVNFLNKQEEKIQELENDREFLICVVWYNQSKQFFDEMMYHLAERKGLVVDGKDPKELQKEIAKELGLIDTTENEILSQRILILREEIQATRQILRMQADKLEGY